MPAWICELTETGLEILVLKYRTCLSAGPITLPLKGQFLSDVYSLHCWNLLYLGLLDQWKQTGNGAMLFWSFKKRQGEWENYRLRRGLIAKAGCSFVLAFISGSLIDTTFLRPWSIDHISTPISNQVKEAISILIKGIIHQEDITIITAYCAKWKESVMGAAHQNNAGTCVSHSVRVYWVTVHLLLASVSVTQICQIVCLP